MNNSYSLEKEVISRLLGETLPSYQASSTEDLNLGFGFLYYSLARLLRPHNILVIGSKAGFSVILFALALKDNAGAGIQDVQCYDTLLKDKNVQPLVHFVDPSYSESRKDTNHWHGIGFWDSAEATHAHWAKFGVERFIRHYKMTSQNYLVSSEQPSSFDLILIDGDHSYEGVRHDIQAYRAKLSTGGLMLAHDVDPRLKERYPETGGYAALRDLTNAGLNTCILPVFPGLAIIRKD